MEGKSYLDDIEIHSIDVFERMEKDDIMVMTSQPSTGSLQEAVQKSKIKDIVMLLVYLSLQDFLQP